MRQLLATIEVARPHNMVAASACVLGGYYLSGGTGFVAIVIPLLCTALVSGLGFLINDYCDARIDHVNKPQRPIPSGRVSRQFVFAVYVVGTIITTTFKVWLLPRPMLILLVAWEVALYFYARKGKRMTLVGNVLVASMAASAFLGGAMLAGEYSLVFYAMVFAFLLVMGRELVKGAEDVAGDRDAGAMTVAVRIGAERSAVWAAVALCLCVIVAPVPTLIGDLSRLYGLVMGLIVVPGLLVATHTVLCNPRRPAFNRASWILKFEMFFGIVAVALGAP